MGLALPPILLVLWEATTLKLPWCLPLLDFFLDFSPLGGVSSSFSEPDLDLDLLDLSLSVDPDSLELPAFVLLFLFDFLLWFSLNGVSFSSSWIGPFAWNWIGFSLFHSWVFTLCCFFS